MGIKGLGKFLKKYIPECIIQKNLADLKDKVIAIDTNYYLYKYSISTRDYIEMFGRQHDHLVSFGIKPLYVFDGKPPKEKQKVIEKRKFINGKKNINVNLDKIVKLKNFFNKSGIVYLECSSEADFICSQLSYDRHIYGCITDDMDFLALGCPLIFRDYYQNSNDIYEYNILEIQQHFSKETFIDICIFLGCDYCDRVLEYVNRALDINIYELFKNHHTLENVWNHCLDNSLLMITKEIDFGSMIANWNKAREILLNKSILYDNEDLKIIEFLKKYSNFSKVKNYKKKEPKKIKMIECDYLHITNRFDLLNT